MSAPRFARFLRFFSGTAASGQQIGAAPVPTRLLDREIARIPVISLGPRLSAFALVVKNSFLIVSGYTASYNGGRWVLDQLFSKRIRAKEEAQRFDSFHFKDKFNVIPGEKESPQLAVAMAELKTTLADLKRRLNSLEEDMTKVKMEEDMIKVEMDEFKKRLNSMEEDMIKLKMDLSNLQGKEVKNRLIDSKGEQMSVLEQRTWSAMEIAAVATVAVATWFGREKSS